MEYRTLGSSGLQVPVLCLGTATFGGEGWPLEARGSDVYGPHGPTAGPPPYAIYRLEATKVFGFPGMHGMFDDDRPHAATRWEFADE